MLLKQYWEELPHGQKKRFAAETGFTVEHLTRVVYGRARCSCNLALAIERASKKVVTRKEAAPHIEW